MSKEGRGGCVLSLPVVLLLIVIGVVGAAAALSLASGSFGKGFAEGGGTMELFSDDIIATNNGDGITVAAKDSEIGDMTNTVAPSNDEGEWAALLPLCLIRLVFAGLAAWYAHLSSGSGYDHY